MFVESLINLTRMKAIVIAKHRRPALVALKMSNNGPIAAIVIRAILERASPKTPTTLTSSYTWKENTALRQKSTFYPGLKGRATQNRRRRRRRTTAWIKLKLKLFCFVPSKLQTPIFLQSSSRCNNDAMAENRDVVVYFMRCDLLTSHRQVLNGSGRVSRMDRAAHRWMMNK